VNYSDLPTEPSLSFSIHREQPQKLHSFFGITFPPRAGVLVPKIQIFYPERSRRVFLQYVPNKPLIVLMVKTLSILPEKQVGFVIQNLFLPSKKSISDAILNPRYSSPTKRRDVCGGIIPPQNRF
jgi:hypothetical protein